MRLSRKNKIANKHSNSQTQNKSLKARFCFLPKSQKGYTLVFVMITVAVLSIMGAAVLSMTFMAHRIYVSERNGTFALYAAESGLDEAYAQILAASKQFSQDALEHTDIELEAMMEYQNSRYEQYYECQTEKAAGYTVDLAIITGYEADYSNGLLFYDTAGNLDQAILDIWLDDRYKKRYKVLMNDYISDWTFTESETLTLSLVTEQSRNGNRPTIALNKENNAYKLFTSDDDVAVMPLTSEYLSAGYRNKTVSINIELSIPPYNMSFSIGEDVVRLRPNILWTKALAAGENIFVKQGNVVVHGNAYARGTDGSEFDTDYFDKRGAAHKVAAGGLIVGDGTSASGAASFSIIGTEHQFATGKDVYCLTNGSAIRIDGDVYCDNLIVHEDTSNINIALGENLFTSDDLEHNGTNSHISIAKRYYGFTDADRDTASIVDSAGTAHLGSSGIIINSTDINASSSITIRDGIFIAGTDYIDLYNEDGSSYGFRTGESISIKGNYRAYGIDIFNDEDMLRRLYYDLYADRGVYTSSSALERYVRENIEFEYFEPVHIAHKFTSESAFTTNDYTRYFELAAKQEYINNMEGAGNLDYSRINFGGYDEIDTSYGINIFNPVESAYENLTLGATIYNNNVHIAWGAIDTILDIQNEIAREHNIQINKIGNIAYNLTADNDLDYEKNTFDDQFNFDSFPTGLYNGSTSDNTIIVNNLDTPLYIDEDYSQGIIISKSDIHIVGEVNFKGVIISSGNIIFEGSGTKTITSDVRYIAALVHTNKLLRNHFYGVIIDDTFGGLDPTKRVAANYMYLPEDYYKFSVDIVDFNEKVKPGFGSSDASEVDIYNNPKRFAKIISWRVD